MSLHGTGTCLVEQPAETGELVEADAAYRIVDEVEVAGVDAVDGKHTDGAVGKQADVGQLSPLLAFFEPGPDDGKVFRGGAGAPETETRGIVVAGNHEDPLEIEAGRAK